MMRVPFFQRLRLESVICHYLPLAIVIIASGFPLVVAWLRNDYITDDAYITLTYVKNIVSGRGFVFNHPPPVLGTTTPLFTLVVAALAWLLPVDIPSLAVLVSALCWSGTIWLFYLFRKAWQIHGWHASIIGLVLAASGFVTSLGMEAYLFAFLLVLALSLYWSERYLLSGLSIGLLFLTRGEGILILVLLVLWNFILIWREHLPRDPSRWQSILLLIIDAAVPMLAWFFFAFVTFGSILPNTLSAKMAHSRSGLWIPFLPRLLALASTWQPRFQILSIPLLNVWWLLIAFGIAALIAFRKRLRWLVFLVWIGAYIAGYSILNVMGAWWYQWPVLFVANIFFALGIIAVVEIINRLIRSRLLAMLVSVVLSGVLIVRLAQPTVQLAITYEDYRGEAYTALSRWFRENTQSSESIAFIEIGYLGFYTDNRIVDLAGLVLPDVVEHVAKGDLAWAFWRYEPDYFVYSIDFDWAFASIRNDPRFDGLYRQVASIATPGRSELLIFKRQK